MSTGGVINLQTSIIIILSIVVLLVGLTIILQDLKILPSMLIDPPSLDRPLPNEAERFFFDVDQGAKLEVWRQAPPNPNSTLDPVIICHHGNGNNVENFYSVQQDLSNLGFTVYQYDYRGVGNSTGWPSEKALSGDALKLHLEVAKRHNLPPEEIIVLGISFGSGPASFVANTVNSKRVLLYTPYLGLRKLISQLPSWVRFLSPFVWYNFDNQQVLREWVTRSQSNNQAQVMDSPRNLIIIHGLPDEVIPFAHSKELLSDLKGIAPASNESQSNETTSNDRQRVNLELIEHPTAGHGTIFDDTFSQVRPVLLRFKSEIQSSGR